MRPDNPTQRATISAVLIARDEAHNLPDCLARLDWVDETIVVVDPAGLDATEATARRLANRVVVRPFDDFASQRNAGLDHAQGDWILSIDADERVTTDLAAEIQGILNDPAPGDSAYRLPIRSVILGRKFQASGTQNDRPIRLFRSGARWDGKVHEVVRPAGSVGTLQGHLEHQTLPNMRSFLRKLDAYTSLEAEQFLRDDRPHGPVDLLLRPPWTFAKLYLGKQGFRDGLEGLMFCALSAVSVAVRHWKHRELLQLRVRGSA